MHIQIDKITHLREQIINYGREDKHIYWVIIINTYRFSNHNGFIYKLWFKEMLLSESQKKIYVQYVVKILYLIEFVQIVGLIIWSRYLLILALHLVSPSNLKPLILDEVFLGKIESMTKRHFLKFSKEKKLMTT